MPFFIPALIAGVSALAGGLGNKDKKVTTTTDSNTTSNLDQSTAPVYDPLQIDMKNELYNQYMARLGSGGAEADAITRGSIYNINQNYDLAGKTAENFARARGLGRTTLGSVPAASVFAGRAGAVAGAQNNNPLLRRQFDQENLGNFASFFSRLPVGSHTTGTNTSHTTGKNVQTTPGSPWGGALGSLAGTVAGLFGAGAFGGGGGQPSYRNGVSGGDGQGVWD